MAINSFMGETNSRLRNLDARLEAVYNAALNKALKNEKAAINRLEAYKSTIESLRADGVPEYEIKRNISNYMKRIERETHIVNNISAEIANTAETARKIIENERLNLYRVNYNGALNSINKQLGNIDLPSIDWTIYDRNQLRAILSGEYQPFEKVGAREIFVRSQKDIAKGYVRERAFGKLGDNKVIVRRLQNTLAEAIVLGESIPQIATRIKKVGDMSRRQAVTIARTETLRVANQGRMLGYVQAYNDFAIEQDKQWLATVDSRTRDDHAEMHLVKVALDEPFIMPNGDEMMQPLDGSLGAGAENIVNCRCVVVSVLRGLTGSKAYRELEERIKNR